MKASLVVYLQCALVLKQQMRLINLGSIEKPDIDQYFNEQVLKWGTGAEDREKLARFFADGERKFALKVQPSDAVLKQSLHAVYERICEEIGPVATDKLFSQSLSIVAKTSKAAHSFSPHNLM